MNKDQNKKTKKKTKQNKKKTKTKKKHQLHHNSMSGIYLTDPVFKIDALLSYCLNTNILRVWVGSLLKYKDLLKGMNIPKYFAIVYQRKKSSVLLSIVSYRYTCIYSLNSYCASHNTNCY